VHTRGGKRRRHYGQSASARACVLSFCRRGPCSSPAPTLVTSGFEVLASSLGFMAASAFVSDERVLNVGIGVAQLRLANLVQGDWLSGASQVGYQGSIDHLMRAERFDDLPGASRLVGSSSWIRCTGGPRRSRHRRHREILGFQHDSTWFFGFMDVGEIRQASRKVLAKEIRRVAAARVAPGPGQTAGSGGRTGSVSFPPDG
jgi:hypothetical protein